MDAHQFDSMSQVAARLPDRRNMLKVVAAAALTGVAGAALRPEDGLAKQRNNNNNKRNRNKQRGLVNVVITDVLNNLTVSIPVKNNNIAVQICAAVEVIDVDLLALNTLRCEVEQRQ